MERWCGEAVADNRKLQGGPAAETGGGGGGVGGDVAKPPVDQQAQQVLLGWEGVELDEASIGKGLTVAGSRPSWLPPGISGSGSEEEQIW
jgi:hypothetical protein